MENEAIGTLDAGEQAYFESSGEAEISSEIEQPSQDGLPETEQSNELEQVVDEERELQPKQQKTVPLAALHEERAKAKEMRQRLQQLEEQTRIGNERLQMLAAAIQQKNNPQPEIPDFDKDPATHLYERLERTEANQRHIAQYALSQQQEAARQAAIHDLMQEVSRQEAEYAEKTPDYRDALEHLKSSEISALMAIGHDQQSATQIIHNQFGSIAWELRQRGESIPEKVYALAKARGYNPQQVTNQQKMQTLQKGVSAAKSLGTGGKVSSNLSLESLASLPAADFAELVKDERAWRRLMGG